MFLFSSQFGEDEPILTSRFFNWVVQPPPSTNGRSWHLGVRVQGGGKLLILRVAFVGG